MAKFVTYLYRVAHNRVVDQYRRSGHLVTVTLDDEEIEEPASEPCTQPDAHYERKARAQRLIALIDALPLAQREAFVLRARERHDCRRDCCSDRGQPRDGEEPAALRPRETARGHDGMAMNGQPRDARPADDTSDPEVACLYRAASREAPPAHLDAFLLAAARREAGAHPRALDKARTLVSGRERAWRAARAWRIPFAVTAVVVLSVSVLVLDPDPDSRPETPPTGARERASAETGTTAFSATQPLAARALAHEPPEKWGENIVELRRLGRAGEADALLADFRQRFPGYRVPDEWTR